MSIIKKKQTSLLLDENLIKDVKIMAIKKSISYNMFIELAIINALNKAKEEK